MIKLIFATGNPNKVSEVAEILGPAYQIESLKDIGAPLDLPETRRTLEGNAIQKAEYVVENFKVDCFSEDTGLEIDALNGAPGIHAARYAGLQKDSEANMDLVLKQLEGTEDRTARFRTVIALMKGGQTYLFEGVLEGNIQNQRSGSKGFGYDPIFQPLGYNTTLAEMSAAEKNKISHRGRAIQKLITFLKSTASS